MGTAGTAGGGGGAHPGFYPTGGKVKHPPAGPCPKQREPGADQPLSSPSTCPHAAAKAVPAGGPCRSAVPADTLAQKTWLSVRDERATREPFREGCARRPAWRLGEVGGGELERLSWRQVQRVPAAPWRGSFLPPSLPPLFLPSLFSSFPSSRLPFSLIPAQSPSCHPDSNPSPPPTVTCKPKDKTRPPSVTCGPPKRPHGPPRSRPEPSRALSRLLPHPRASERPRRQLLLLWGPQAEALPGRPQTARLGGSGVNASYSHSGAAAGSRGSSGLPPAPIQRAWVAVGDKQGFLGTQRGRGGHVVLAQGSQGNVGPLSVATLEMDAEKRVQQESRVCFKI